MSEAVTEEPTEEAAVTEPEVTEDKPTVEVDDNGIPVVITDDFGKMAYAKAKSEGEAFVALQNEISLAEGDPSAMLDSLRNIWGTDQDSEVTDTDRKARAKIEEYASAILKIEEARDARLNERIKTLAADASTKVEPLKTEAAKRKDTYQGAVKLLTGMFGDDAAYGLPSVKGTRKAGSGSGSGGTSAPRIRGFNFFVDGTLASQADKDGKQLSNAAAASKPANVATSVIQEGFWAAQGTQDSAKYKDSVEYTVTDADGNEHAIIARRQVKAA